jgi:hypothetical protein
VAAETEEELVEPEAGSPRRGARPGVIVAATLAAVVSLSFLIYSVGDSKSGDVGGGGSNLSGAGAQGACGVGNPDPSYTIAVTPNPDPPRPDGTTLNISVRQAGQAITGAKVCVSADMPDMGHDGMYAVAKELSGGQYETRFQFGMDGGWKLSLTVAPPGKAAVSVPLNLQVAAISPD